MRQRCGYRTRAGCATFRSQWDRDSNWRYYLRDWRKRRGDERTAATEAWASVHSEDTLSYRWPDLHGPADDEGVARPLRLANRLRVHWHLENLGWIPIDRVC